MSAIFYDLETTDKEPIGQILNYCFIEVDKHLEPKRELVGTIRVNRLQLPRAGALLANRTDIQKHQAEATKDEREALLEISRFLASAIKKSRGRLPFIGYNSTRFDLPYLRTSFIRNGINPYFGGKLLSRDLLHVVRKLSCTSSKFPRVADSKDDNQRLSLRLETVTKKLGLLKSAQTHYSRDDVILTIDLARELLESFALDVRVYEPYEAAHLHRQLLKTPRVVCALKANYDLSSPSLAVETPLVLLDSSDSGALWIDLERYQAGEGARSISWYNTSTSPLVVRDSPFETDFDEKIVDAALKNFSGTNLKNYFTRSKCDIEQDIYRLNFSALDILSEVIEKGQSRKMSELKSRDAKILLLRYQMATYGWGGDQDERIQKMLEQYSLYRYGGKALMVKFADADEYQEGIFSEHYHPTWNELYAEIEEARGAATSREDRAILDSLESFYLESDIYRVAGEALLGIQRAPQKAA